MFACAITSGIFNTDNKSHEIKTFESDVELTAFSERCMCACVC